MYETSSFIFLFYYEIVEINDATINTENKKCVETAQYKNQKVIIISGY